MGRAIEVNRYYVAEFDTFLSIVHRRFAFSTMNLATATDWQ